MATVSVFTFTADDEEVTKTKLNNLVANLVTDYNGNIQNVNMANNSLTSAKFVDSGFDLAAGKITGKIPGANINTTVGTVVAGEGVTVDANKDTSGQRNITITGAFIIGSASMDETDLEKLDGITNGTVAANKAIVVDASKQIDTIGITGVFAMDASSTITANSETVTDNQIGYLNDVTSDIQAQIDAKQPEPYSGSQAGAVLNTTYNFTHGLGGIPSRFEAYVDDGTNRYPCQNNDTANNGATITATATQLTIKGTSWFARYNGTSITSGTLTVFAWA